MENDTHEFQDEGDEIAAAIAGQGGIRYGLSRAIRRLLADRDEQVRVLIETRALAHRALSGRIEEARMWQDTTEKLVIINREQAQKIAGLTDDLAESKKFIGKISRTCARS